jgi:phosphoglycerate dehydrogenase-like enzyme
MLTFAHRLPELRENQLRNEWPQGRLRLPDSQELRGAAVGIIGYGSIGREVGRLSSAYGMRVLALKRTADRVDRGYTLPGVGDPQAAIPERLYRPDELKLMLAECDFVVLAVPLTAVTRNLIGRYELRSMKASAFLINIARGGVVDEPILIQALQEGWIAGAGLDVFAQEPLPADSPLWRIENAILTPHIAGLTPHYNNRAEDLFAQNLRRYLSGEPLLNQVDYERGY